MDWKDRNVLLTGASRGLGAMIARTLAAKGANLVIAARSAEPLRALAAECTGVRVLAVPCDVGDAAALGALVEAAEAFGPIDILINNAGIEHAAPYETIPVETIEQIVRVNLVGPMVLTRLMLPHLLARGRGHVVNMSSVAGLGPAAFAEPYGATKHGLVGFTKALRATLKANGSGVSASVICPGFVADIGMYEVMRRDHGASTSLFMGLSRPELVVDAVIRAVEKDLPDIVVNPMPLRPTLALSVLFPRIMERVLGRLRVHETFRVTALSRGS
jgi:short-subunit dehydrogenase